MARKVQFVETVLRDANQSLIATRLPFEKFEPMLETIDKAGYYAVTAKDLYSCFPNSNLSSC